MRLKTIFALVALIGAMGFASMGVCGDPPAKSTPAVAGAERSGPVAYFPAKMFEFESVLAGKEIVHDFVVRNKGDAELKIEKVKTT